MQYVPFINARGNRDIQLDISNLDIPDKDTYTPMLLFGSTAYTIHRNKDKVTTTLNAVQRVTPEQLWDTVFYSVNQFFNAISEDDQIKIAMILMIMHREIDKFILEDNPERISWFMQELGGYLEQLDKEIDLCPKLEHFADTSIPIGDFSEAGTRAQDSEALTFYRPEVIKLTAIVLLCKMLTPIFGLIMDYLKRVVDTGVKSQHCSHILSKIFFNRYGVLIDKLNNYIVHATETKVQESATMVYNGNTINSLCDKIRAGLFIRNFVNVNLFQPNGNLMKFIIVSIKKSADTQLNNAKKTPVLQRIPIDSGSGDDGNTAQSEIDSITSKKTADVTGIVEIITQDILRKHLMDPNYDIALDEFEACRNFYERNPLRPHAFNKFLNCIFYARDMDGGRGVQLLHASQYTDITTMLQMILFSQGKDEIGHLLTARPGIDVKTMHSAQEDFIRINYRNSYPYKNCKALYEQGPLGVGGKDWDKQFQLLVEDLLKTNYYYNTAPFLWDARGVDNLNGQLFVPSTDIIKKICSFIELVNEVEQIEFDFNEDEGF